MKIIENSDITKNNGVVFLSDNDKESIISIKKSIIQNHFEKSGMILFRNFDINKENLIKITDKFTKQYSNDAVRRSKRFDNKNVRSVDQGFGQIDLHSESSFNPAWPEIVWFYCLVNPQNGGESMICDGLKLWSLLDKKTKDFFQSNPIVYKLAIPIENKMNKKGKRDWAINVQGVSNCVLDWDSETLFLDQIRFACHEGRESNMCFANHLFVTLQSEPQILSRTLINNNKIPSKILDEIHRKSNDIILDLKLKSGDLLMLDNKRFMHGRRAFSNAEERDILSIQTLKANFGYGEISRIK